MPSYHRYPTPYLLGRVDYTGQHRLDPDGDTIHLRDPVLLVDGRVTKPKDSKLVVWVSGRQKPKTFVFKGKPGADVPIRFERLDAPKSITEQLRLNSTGRWSQQVLCTQSVGSARGEVATIMEASHGLCVTDVTENWVGVSKPR